MTRSEGKQSRFWTLQGVYVQNPPISSPAHLVLLTKKYWNADHTIYSNCRMQKIRNEWMRLQMQTPDALGGLTCKICGREGLNPWAKNIKKKAVLDHIHEIGCGGAWDDPANFQVLCERCNNTKDKLRQRNHLTIH